jgi:hypothetical protein
MRSSLSSFGRNAQFGGAYFGGGSAGALEKLPPKRRSSKLVKPQAVLSYNPQQSKFKEFVLKELQAMGFSTWCRTDTQGDPAKRHIKAK